MHQKGCNYYLVTIFMQNCRDTIKSIWTHNSFPDSSNMNQIRFISAKKIFDIISDHNLRYEFEADLYFPLCTVQ